MFSQNLKGRRSKFSSPFFYAIVIKLKRIVIKNWKTYQSSFKNEELNGYRIKHEAYFNALNFKLRDGIYYTVRNYHTVELYAPNEKESIATDDFPNTMAMREISEVIKKNNYTNLLIGGLGLGLILDNLPPENITVAEYFPEVVQLVGKYYPKYKIINADFFEELSSGKYDLAFEDIIPFPSPENELKEHLRKINEVKGNTEVLSASLIY